METLDIHRLFVEHHRALFRYLDRMSGDPDAAADAVQEAFLKLAERPPSDTSKPRAWLFTVATNHLRESLRTKRRHGELLETAGDRVPIGSPAPDPASLAESAEARRIVRAALDELSERERTMLLMREEGFKHREIAAAVGTTTKSVGTLLTRALRKMSVLLENRINK